MSDLIAIGEKHPTLGELVFVGKSELEPCFDEEGKKIMLRMIHLAYRQRDGMTRKGRFSIPISANVYIAQADEYMPVKVTDPTTWPQFPSDEWMNPSTPGPDGAAKEQ